MIPTLPPLSADYLAAVERHGVSIDTMTAMVSPLASQHARDNMDEFKAATHALNEAHRLQLADDVTVLWNQMAAGVRAAILELCEHHGDLSFALLQARRPTPACDALTTPPVEETEPRAVGGPRIPPPGCDDPDEAHP